MEENHKNKTDKSIGDGSINLCSICKSGHMINDVQENVTSHHYRCDECGATMNIDSGDVIVK